MPRKGAVILKKINENGNRFASKLNIYLYFVCSFFALNGCNCIACLNEDIYVRSMK